MKDLNLPAGFTVVNARGQGDCFFDACAQGVSAILKENYTTEGLRRLCSDYMMEAVRSGYSQHPIYNVYLSRIKEKNKKMPREHIVTKATALYMQRARQVAYSAEDVKLLGLDGGAIWGEQEVDGRMICIKINELLAKNGSEVKITIHTVEVTDIGVTHHLIDENGETIVSEELEIAQLYKDLTIVHMVCHNSHWQSILYSEVVPRLAADMPSDPSVELKDYAESSDSVIDYEMLFTKLAILELDKGVVLELRETVKIILAPIKVFNEHRASDKAFDSQHRILQSIEGDLLVRKKQLMEKLSEKETAEKHALSKEKLERVNQGIEVVRLFKGIFKHEFHKKVEDFFNFLLADETKLKQIFFGEIILLEEHVTHRFREISKLLHPDKNGGREQLATKLYQHLTKIRGNILKDIKKEISEQKGDYENVFDQISSYEAQAQVYWEEAIDYQNALKDGAILKRLNKSFLINLHNAERLERKHASSRSACTLYRAAVRLIDKEIQRDKTNNVDSRSERSIQLFEKQIELRSSMALALYMADLALEAQICILGVLRLIENNPASTDKHYLKPLSILEKIQKTHSNPLPQADEPVVPISKSMEVVLANNSSQIGPVVASRAIPDSQAGRRDFSRAIIRDISELAIRKMVSPDHKIVSYTTPKEIILKTRQEALAHRTAGRTLIAGGLGLVVAGGIGAGIQVAVAAEAISVAGAMAALGGPIGILGGAAVLLGGLIGSIFGGVKLFEKGSKLMEEPLMRENLNDIIARAVDHYSKGEYIEFFEALSENYSEDSYEEKQLINFRRGIMVDIRTELLKPPLSRYSSPIPMLIYNGSDFTLKQLIVKRNEAIQVQRVSKVFEKSLIESMVLCDIRLALDTMQFSRPDARQNGQEILVVMQQNNRLKIIFNKKQGNEVKAIIIDGTAFSHLDLKFDGKVLVRNKVFEKFFGFIYEKIQLAGGCIHAKQKTVLLDWDHPVMQIIASNSDYGRYIPLEVPLRGHVFSSPPSEGIISELIAHGFRADGIAYLLNIIGETIISRKIKVPEEVMVAADLTTLSIRIFEAIIKSAELYKSAASLDEAVDQARQNWTGFKWVDRKFNIAMKGYAKRRYDIPKEYFEDATKAPFMNRLEEMRNIAKMNLAIIHIIVGAAGNLSKASQCIRDIRESVNKHHQYFTIPEERLHVLQDFLFALGVVEEEEPEIVPAIEWITLPLVVHHDQRTKYTIDAHYQLADDRNIFTLLYSLSKGAVSLDYNAFLKKLEIEEKRTEFSQIARKLITMLKREMPMTARMLEREHLPLLAHVFGVELKLCHQNQRDTIHHYVLTGSVTPKAGTPIKAVVYVAFDNIGEVVPSVAFVANDDIYLKRLYAELACATDLRAISKIRSSIASYYCDEARRTEKTNHIRALFSWKEALEQYRAILDKQIYDIGACLGHAECQLQMSKFKKAETFLETRKLHMRNDSNYLPLRATIARKQGAYAKANDFLHAALKANPNDQQAKKEFRIVGKLRDSAEQYTLHYRSTQVAIEPTFLTVRQQDKVFYDILSIDGGGIRGIIPAVWLSEIEKRAHRPVAHLFNLIAGTSTGGVIAAGLTMPGDTTAYKPRYRAYELLDMYQTKGSEIFTFKPGISRFMHSVPIVGGAFATEKYTAEGRSNVFNAYFGGTKLSDSITDLVIPAVDENHLQQTYLFTRGKARKNPTHNYRLFDAAMATSAAPTFFPVYKTGRSSFIDGGINANNPAELACNEALGFGIDERNINVLSLGTGDCVSDPLNVAESRNGLFWAMNLHKPALIPQAGNVDDALEARLSNRYQRWQCWFEDAIPFDDYSPTTISRLIDMARESIAEMDGSDENPINRTVERLCRNREV